MLALNVLLEGHPLKQRLNGMLEAKEVPPAFAARLRRRIGINCNPNECCNRQIADVFTRAGTDLQDEYARICSVPFEDDTHFRMLILLAALAEKSIAPVALTDRREVDCIDACDLSMPEGVGWMKLLDHMVRKIMGEHDKHRWLVWVEPANENARAQNAFAISRSQPSGAQGSPLIPSGSTLYLSAKTLAQLSHRWPDVIQRLQSLMVALSDHYFTCECWAEVKLWSDFTTVAPELAREIGKWFEGGSKAFLRAVESGQLGRLCLQTPLGLKEAQRCASFRNHWKLWATFHDEVRRELKVVAAKRR